MRVPIEAEEVEPPLQLVPVEAAVGSDEPGQVPVHPVYRLQRVLMIGKAFGLGGRMDLALQIQKVDQGLVGFVAVMDDPRPFGYVAGVPFDDLAPARLARAAHGQRAPESVGRGADAELVPR